MAPSSQASRAVSFLWLAVGYGLAGAAAYGLIAVLPPGLPQWQVVLATDLAATAVVFAFSVVCDNSSIYDPYWSVAPMVIASALVASGAAPEVPVARQALVTGLVLLWGARLTFNFARGWDGLRHEDWRYVEIRRRAGRAYWVASFIGIHAMPTLWVYLGCLSLIPALVTGTRPLGLLDAVAAVVTAGAILVETVADEQLRRFRRSNPAPGRTLEQGLWAVSRHPNYLGEISFWWGLYLFALAADPSTWGCVAGPLSITLLFTFVSVPLIDRRSLARRPGYAEHMARVPGLFPRPWRRRAP
jgi:steroid 5-alpha reductase family enzyme